MFNLSRDPAELDDLLRTGGGATVQQLAVRMKASLKAALDGDDPDSVDRRFKAQDRAAFMQWVYQPPGSTERKGYVRADGWGEVAPLSTVRGSWILRLISD